MKVFNNSIEDGVNEVERELAKIFSRRKPITAYEYDSIMFTLDQIKRDARWNTISDETSGFLSKLFKL